MKLNKFALLVFIISLLSSLTIAYPFYSLVLVDLFKGTITDPGFAMMISVIAITSFATCIYSFLVMTGRIANTSKSSTIILSVLLVLTLVVFAVHMMFLYVGSRY